MKYVYCLTDDVGSMDGLPRGLGDMEVQQVSSGGISALVSGADPDGTGDPAGRPYVGSAQNALVHQEVVQAALRLSPSVLPCRFGTLLADEGQILSLLRAHSAGLEAALARVRGRVEVGVEVLLFAPSPALPLSPSGSGGVGDGGTGGRGDAAGERYLLAKKGRYEIARALREQAERLGRELNEATAPLWGEVKAQRRSLPPKGGNSSIVNRQSSIVTPPSFPPAYGGDERGGSNDESRMTNDGVGLLLSLCYLVEREKVPSFQCVYERFKRRWPTVKFLYTGPWPPYSFADLDLSK